MTEGQLCQDGIAITNPRNVSDDRYVHTYNTLCCSAFAASLAALLQATLDNTNPDLETRAVWIRLAQKFGVPVRCVYFKTPAKLCEHNDAVRALAGGTFNPEKRVILPPSAFFSFASRFKEPSEQEGFEEIIAIRFQVRNFSIDMRNSGQVMEPI